MRQGWKALSAAATVVAVVAALGGCGGDQGNRAADGGFELTIGSLLPFTGDLSAISAPIDKAVRLAAEQVDRQAPVGA